MPQTATPFSPRPRARLAGRQGRKAPRHDPDQPPRQPPADGPRLASLDAGIARDIAVMLAEERRLGLARLRRRAARRSAAVLHDTESPYDLQGLAGAASQAEARLH